MSHPDDDLLADLALNISDSDSHTGPGDDTSHAEALAHLAGCAACADTVADLRRALSVARRAHRETGWEAPAPDVWSRITDELDSPPTSGSRPDPPPGSPAPMPSAGSPGSDGTRDHRPGPKTEQPPHAPPEHGQAAPPDELTELRSERRDREAARRPRRIAWSAGLAAAALVIGLLGGRALWHESAPQPPQPVTVAQAPLDTLDTTSPQQLGEAAVVRTSNGYKLDIDTSKPLPAGSGYLEVWLINRDGKRMVSVGVMRNGEGPVSFPITQKLIDEGYVIVDISREQFDDNPAHSGDSVVRGKLPA
ncbi:MAG: anti-sigma factor [Micrococcales bacterium]|nr:anti-sigma factor [Micrococcales bacterium]